MKKNAMMRIASVLLVAVLLTTCSISGTFAKYVSEASGEDSARVAYWGWDVDSTLTIDGLFANAYEADVATTGTPTEVNSFVEGDESNLIAPGTKGSATFSFRYTENATELASTAIPAPEVDYSFDITVTGNCDELIQDNKNIIWFLDGDPADDNVNAQGTWLALKGALEALDGNDNGAAVYEAGNLPANFGVGATHTIGWEWVFTGNETYTVGSETLSQDEYDTYMGNMDDLDDVSITITITATQIN